jgi:shikimate kinase
MVNELGCHPIRVPEAYFFRFGSMRVFITGVSCVGKTSIGAILASRLGFRFYDLDVEIEGFFKTSIERLRNKFLTVESFRNEAIRVLMNILGNPESRNCVIALPPSGLMGCYFRALKKAGGTIAVLTDKPENILNRITFYDIDSHPLEKQLTQREKLLYLREIKKDITYYRKSYDRADLRVDISGMSAEAAAEKVQQSLKSFLSNETKHDLRSGGARGLNR